MPNQRDVRWSQLKIGVLVLVAIATLLALIFLMTGSGGLFSRRITVRSYFQNASGLKPGAPVNLQGVTIGSVDKVVIASKRKLTPVEVIMRIGTRYGASLHTDSKASLDTVGVLGDTVVNIDSSQATGPPLTDNAELPTNETPSLSDVIKSSQGTIEQLNLILAKVNTLVDAVNSSKGTLGQLINDPGLYNRAVGTLTQLQDLVNQVNQGQGTLGKLVTDDTMYDKVNETVSRLQHMADELDEGHGTVGKLLKDPSLYNNLNQTAAKANTLVGNINEGKGTLGMLSKDQAFAQKVNSTVGQMQALLRDANAGRGTVGKFLKDPSLYNHSDETIQEMRSLLAAVRANPKKYLVIRMRIF